MTRSRGDMGSPRLHIVLLAVVHLIPYIYAGPLGPLPNVTSADMGIKEGSCALGDVVYLPGDQFPGSSPCEKCRCTERGVQCTQQQCEPRPGCKALHRPDQCCPTYQCECEQEGRVYGNGEKLVDPEDPCRVCYCQGGEVVCRRIACFLRDDCTPRLVPGRCCPEYDNCPLRGVTSLPSMTPPNAVPTSELIPSSAAPAVPKEIVKPEITIKEITPVSEIPIITDVKIKEIIPSPTMDVGEYSSSKSPLIPREATSEKSIKADVEPIKMEPEVASPSVIEIHPSSETISPEIIRTTNENKAVDDAPPSKISLSTQDSINSDIYPSNVPVVATAGSTAASETQKTVSTSKAPLIEEEDPSLFDHNPAFPPLPDDLSVLSSHGDELVPDTPVDVEHASETTRENAPAPEIGVASISPSTEIVTKEPQNTSPKYFPDASVATTEISTTEPSTIKAETLSSFATKEIPVINLRSAIPTEVLSVSSETASQGTSQSIVESSTISEVKHTSESTTTEAPTTTTEASTTTRTTEASTKVTELTSIKQEVLTEKSTPLSTTLIPESQSTTEERVDPSIETSSNAPQEQTTNSIAKSNVPTEITSHTELSSLPIETSNPNPQDIAENVTKDFADISTIGPLTTADKISLSNSEVITVAKTAESGTMENVETTEFILTSFGSSESSTDAVELIKIAGDSTESDKHAAIIEKSDRNKNALSDLIRLVSDVASMSDHTDTTPQVHPVASSSISDSEELIPVNAGYKSKTNYNQNSITEVPIKSKNVTPVNKQKIVEIEDDESGSITDSPPPNDKVEPTTRRPIIDNVSDDNQPEKKSDKKDIEIITQSYVPTINRRPTKVVLQELPQEDEPAPAIATSAASTELATESGETAVPAAAGAVPERRPEPANVTLSTEQ